jgi:hypothetical protein
VVSMLK